MSARSAMTGIVERVRSVDGVFGALATLFGLASLAYPFGRDQGLLYYPAREWLQHGQVLYRDVFAVQPPIAYLVHLLSIAAFGPHLWSIRLVELLVAVPFTGWYAARLATPRGQRVGPGVFGAAWLGVSLVQYGYLAYWDTAQPDIWYAMLAIGGLAWAHRSERELAGYLVAGALSALALWTKLAATPFVFLTLAAIIARAREAGGSIRDFERALGAFFGGVLAVCGVLAAALASLHAFGPMLASVFGANAVYTRFQRGIDNGTDVLGAVTERFVALAPLSSVLVVMAAIAAFVGWGRRDGVLARRYVLPVLLAMATFAAVWAQGRFYPSHWGPLVAPAGLLFALLWQDCVRVVGARALPGVPSVTFLVFAAALFMFSGPTARRWYDTVHDTVRYERGDMSELDFARRFDIPGVFSNVEAVQVSAWLRDVSRPADTVVVRGFEPEIYAMAERRYTGRFFWTTFLTFPSALPEWLEEDRAAIDRDPPRFAVTLNYAPPGPDSPSSFEALGYTRRATMGGLTILEHAPPAGAEPTTPTPAAAPSGSEAPAQP